MKRFFLCLLLSMLINHIIFAQTENELDNETQVEEEITLDIAEDSAYAIRPKAQLKFYKPGEIIHFKNPHYQETEFSNYLAKLGQTQIIKIPNNGYDDIYAGIDINISPGEYLISLETEKKQIELLPFIITMSKQVRFLELDDINILDKPLTSKQEAVDSLIWSNLIPQFPFEYPIDNQWSATFGYYFENQLGGPEKPNNTNRKDNAAEKNISLQRVDHLSMKIENPTTVQSPSDAVCFSISFNENSGYTVLLDHGMGLFSEISGLRNITISEQDRIKKNAVISTFNTLDFIDKESKSTISQAVKWRVFLNKATINPHYLTMLQ